ncbi:hypothetical protein J2T14_000237 [Paenibacillus harenae]|nr:hypothetical protein [Paenibacillus harenae]
MDFCSNFPLLLGHDGESIVIDPKGVIDDPVFEISRFQKSTVSYPSWREN